MGDERELREYTAALVVAGQGAVNQHVAATFRGYVAVLDGDAPGGIAAIRAAVRHTRGGGAAPGQHAILARILLAAYLACGDTDAALAAADRLVDMGGAARLWEPVARRVRAGSGRSARGRAEERSRNASLLPIFPLGGAFADVADGDTAFGGSRSARFAFNMDAIAPDPATVAADRA